MRLGYTINLHKNNLDLNTKPTNANEHTITLFLYVRKHFFWFYLNTESYHCMVMDYLQNSNFLQVNWTAKYRPVCDCRLRENKSFCKNCALLGYYATSIGNSLRRFGTTYRNHIQR